MKPHELPGIKPQVTKEWTPDEVAATAEKTVTMQFPEPVTLTISHGYAVMYPAGVHEVPELLSTHWYLKARGARPADGAGAQ